MEFETNDIVKVKSPMSFNGVKLAVVMDKCAYRHRDGECIPVCFTGDFSYRNYCVRRDLGDTITRIAKREGEA